MQVMPDAERRDLGDAVHIAQHTASQHVELKCLASFGLANWKMPGTRDDKLKKWSFDLAGMLGCAQAPTE